MKVSIASAASTTFLNTKANDKKTAFNIELFYCHFTCGKCLKKPYVWWRKKFTVKWFLEKIALKYKPKKYIYINFKLSL